METARSFPQKVRDDPRRLTFTLAVTVIRHFFGRDWCEDYVIQDPAHSRPVGFLRLDFTPGFEGGRETSRVLYFAETLFNLQHVVTSTTASTRCASVRSFKFVTPTGAKGKDYDFGIEYTDGREACADAATVVGITAVKHNTGRLSFTIMTSELPRTDATSFGRRKPGPHRAAAPPICG